MLQPADKILEAYYNGMGDEFGSKVRERIHWICSQAKGEDVLDIGCSQGITSILLGREGKQVLGIDLIKESIRFANNSLLEESEITKKYVDFKVANFMDYEFGGKKFDSIILSEVLEHLTDPERFLKKAATLLKEDGQVIITVPFGINDYFDHKKTYYLLDLVNEISPCFGGINSIKYFGKWVGIVVRLKGEKINLGSNVILHLEAAFKKIEEDLLQQIKVYKQKNDNISNKLNKREDEFKTVLQEKEELNDKLQLNIKELISSTDQVKSLQEQLSKHIGESVETVEKDELKKVLQEKEVLNDKLQHKIEELNFSTEQFKNLQSQLRKYLEVSEKAVEEINQLQETNVRLVNKNKQLETNLVNDNTDSYSNSIAIDKLKIENQKLQDIVNSLKKEIIEHINSEEKALIAYRTLLDRYENLSNRYTILKQSRLGKLTLSYWKYRNRLFNKK